MLETRGPFADVSGRGYMSEAIRTAREARIELYEERQAASSVFPIRLGQSGKNVIRAVLDCQHVLSAVHSRTMAQFAKSLMNCRPAHF